MWKNIAKGSSREVGYVNYIKAKADGSQSNELSKGTTKGGFTEFSSISIYLYTSQNYSSEQGLYLSCE